MNFIEKYGEAKVNEVKNVFHGTCLISLKKICAEGYKKEFSKVAMYGRGTYFAKQAIYSTGFAPVVLNTEEFYMFVNDILLGPECGIGRTDAGNSGGDGNQIYVVRHDESCVPRFLVCFHKNAK